MSRDSVSRILGGNLSRRSVLKRAAAAGLAAPLAGAMLQGGVRVAGAQEAIDAINYEAIGLRTDLKGQTLSVILGADGPATAWEEKLVGKFSELTGIETKVVRGPESATERLAQYQQLLGAQASDVDAMMIDVIWPGILAPHAIDLKPAMEQNGAYFERIVANNTVNGILVGIPWYTDAGLLYWRADLVEKYGLGQPATWSDLEAAAKTIQDGERAANPDFQGFVWQGAAYEGLTCDALEWQVSNGGGSIIEPDGTVSVNNPQAIAAFERAKGWIGSISPDGVTTYKEEDARGVWQAGNAAFMRNWPYAWALAQADDSVIKDKVGVGLLPKGDGENAQNAATLGGWQMMASKYSKSPDAAVEFCRFMTSFEVQKAHAIDWSRLPTIVELYDDAAVLEAQPFFGSLKDVFLGGAVPRPSTVSADLYNDVSTAYFTAVNEILTGQAVAADRVAALATELEGIMAEL
ncbi:MAG: ABC transporter substrate-binding protein [Chloroflexota bacterium]